MTNSTNTNAQTTQPVPHTYLVRDTFGMSDAPADLPIQGLKKGHHLQHMVPAVKDHFFTPDLYHPLAAWLQDPDGEGFSLHGPTGAGKSSVILQFAARLNWPVYRVNSHSRLELPSIVGHHKIEDGSMKFVYGPLALAMKHGAIFLWDEQDLTDPSVSAGINAVLEGGPLMLEDNGGEIIHPHENFRFVITGNSAGSGDDTGLHIGVQQQNIAFNDRFISKGTSYMRPEDEKVVLMKAVEGLGDEVCEAMIKLANDVRNSYIGNPEADRLAAEAAKKGGNPSIRGRLGITMSTRTIIRWAKYTSKFRHFPTPLKYSLDLALLNKASAGDVLSVTELACNLFGKDEWLGKENKGGK